MVEGDWIVPVPFPNNTAFVVNVAAPVPPYVAVMIDPFHAPDVIFPPTDTSVPTKSFFAMARPPAVVTLPPLVELIASVALDIPKPPDNKIDPVELLVDAVASLDVNFGSVRVLAVKVMVDGDWITPVPFPNSTAFDVNVAAPVPPYVAVITLPFHVPELIALVIDMESAYNAPAIPTPPATRKAPVIVLAAAVVCFTYNWVLVNSDVFNVP